MKDEILSRNPGNGREQATISYEYDFVVPKHVLSQKGGKDVPRTHVFIPWAHLKPTYRGKEKKDAQPLNLKSIRRMSIMMRRYFENYHCIKARFHGSPDSQFLRRTGRTILIVTALDNRSGKSTRPLQRTWRGTLSHGSTKAVVEKVVIMESLWVCLALYDSIVHSRTRPL